MSAFEPVDRTAEPTASPKEIATLPPSAKLVALVLDRKGTLTQTELAETTLLPQRTVRDAIDRLREVGAIVSRFAFSDARKRLYTLTVELPTSE